MTKYLYGASVQGIQNFIFQTNKLKEIVGASELVEEICGKLFNSAAEKAGEYIEDNLLTAAAGNIKYIFENETACKKMVMNFPKMVMETANGITISQAVVKLTGASADISKLEDRLRIQRNRPISISDNAGLMISETARRTGRNGVEYHKDEVVDLGQKQKIDAFDKANRRMAKDLFQDEKFDPNSFPFNINDMTKGDNQNWIAVIHADGNSLGKKLIKLSEKLEDHPEKSKAAFKEFSKLLDKATKEAVQIAFDETVASTVKKENLNKIPFRPVLLGGDDLTAIIRGDLALDFTHTFLEEFEKISKDKFADFDKNNELTKTLFSEGLTACSGIAYIKSNYPFHYGANLAESLCQEAKKASKKINKDHSPSSIMFHKVHASFVEDYDQIIEKELRPQKEIFFNYGPYFIRPQDDYDTIDELKRRINLLQHQSSPKSGLRNWLTELQNNPEKANQSLQRIISLNKGGYSKSLELVRVFKKRNIKIQDEEIIGKFTPFYDAISLIKIQNVNDEKKTYLPNRIF